MYLSTHDVFKSHAVFLFYILKGEIWVWYGATHIQDYDYEKQIGENLFQGHLMKVTSSKSVFFFYQNAWNKKTKMTKTIDFPNEPFLKASKTIFFFFKKIGIKII